MSHIFNGNGHARTVAALDGQLRPVAAYLTANDGTRIDLRDIGRTDPHDAVARGNDSGERLVPHLADDQAAAVDGNAHAAHRSIGLVGHIAAGQQPEAAPRIVDDDRAVAKQAAANFIGVAVGLLEGNILQRAPGYVESGNGAANGFAHGRTVGPAQAPRTARSTAHAAQDAPVDQSLALAITAIEITGRTRIEQRIEIHALRAVARMEMHERPCAGPIEPHGLPTVEPAELTAAAGQYEKRIATGRETNDEPAEQVAAHDAVGNLLFE